MHLFLQNIKKASGKANETQRNKNQPETTFCQLTFFSTNLFATTFLSNHLK